MVAYVSFVAIANLFLGMLLARILAPGDVTDRQPTTTRRRELDPLPVDSAQTALFPRPPENAIPIGQEIVPTTPTSETKDSDTEPHDPPKAPAAPVKSWGEFATLLRDVKDRTYYCRTAQSAHLAQQAAEQLRACAKEWYGQFEGCLRGEKLDEATQTLIAGKSMMAVEMFAAQIETTLSNVDAIDFTTNVDDILNTLERELEMLDQQQKSVGRSKSDT
jgi:hypothetical protein